MKDSSLPQNPLLIVGSVAIDNIRTPHGSASDQLGGSATFAALSARFWGQPLILSAIGLDFPQSLLSELKQGGLNLNDLTLDKQGKSFRWEGVYDETLGTRQTIGLELGVMATATLQAPIGLQNVRVAMMGTYHPVRQLELLAKLPAGVFVATDTIAAYIKYERAALTELYKKSTLITLNDEELCEYTCCEDLGKGVEHLFGLGAEYVIIKHGQKGSHLYTAAGDKVEVGAYQTQAKDTTGAGDSYLGALLAVVNAKGKPTLQTLAEGMRFGSAVASLTVEAFGVDRLLPARWDEVNARAESLRSSMKISSKVGA